jgi:hypothetical protein
MEIKLKPYQDRYVFNPTRHPAMIAGWGTGKTMCAILRAMIYSETIPDNLGIIFRREYVDLRDSTLRDFEKYTGIKVNSQRNAQVGSSMIMFRHVEELNNLQNLNLGWFFIEQAEELASDEEFFMLWGRLRRDLKPSDEFLKLGLSIHSGWITGSVKGDNWIRSLWKLSPEPEFSLIEATTIDNAENLPADYLKSLCELKRLKLDVYRQYVENDWEVSIEGRVFRGVDECAVGQLEEPKPGRKYKIGIDVAKYRDFWVSTVIDVQSKRMVGFDRSNKLDWNFQKARTLALAQKWNNAEITIDSTGVGDPIYEDLQRMGLSIDPYQFTNQSKKVLIENLALMIEQRQITYPPIQELIDELKCFEAEFTSANNIRYNAPQGKHDDCVISLALTCWGLTSQPALISAENFLTGIRR